MEKTIIAQIIGNNAKGGVESVVFNYYKFIDKSKFQFDFFIHDNSPNEIPDDITKLGCRVFKIPSYKHIFKYINFLKKICIDNKYNIVHSHMSTISVFSLYAAKKAGIPVRISHSHATAGKGKGEYLRNFIKYILRKFSKLYATHYFACSEYAGLWLFGNIAYKNNQISILNNAVDINNFIFKEEIRFNKRNELNINDKYVIGHVGRFMPQKNHNFIIDIFFEINKTNKNCFLLLIGDGELRKYIEEKVIKLNLQDKIIFLGNRNDVNELYQAMDVFVLPSLYEGLPVVLVETQISGLPSIISDRITKETKFTDLVNFLQINKNPVIWAEKILSKQNINRYDTSKNINIQKYSISDQVKNLESHYERMLSNIQ